MKKGKPNMRDVAKNANVSASAVWMVVNHKAGVSPETEARIWEVISELGYEVKSNQRLNINQVVGLLIEKGSMQAMMDSFYGDVISWVQSEAND